jgi:hypothetical protein
MGENILWADADKLTADLLASTVDVSVLTENGAKEIAVSILTQSSTPELQVSSFIKDISTF